MWAANKIQSSDPEPTFIGGATRTRHSIIPNSIIQQNIYEVRISWQIGEFLQHCLSIIQQNMYEVWISWQIGEFLQHCLWTAIDLSRDQWDFYFACCL
jgi:hypothetical protein